MAPRDRTTATTPRHVDSLLALHEVRVTQGRWTGNTGRAAENVVREMDPDVVVREAEGGRGGRCVGLTILCRVFGVSAYSWLRFSPIIRAMTWRCHTCYLRTCVLGTLRTRLTFAVMPTSRDERRAFAALFSSRGPQFVRSACFFACGAAPWPILKPLLESSATARQDDDVEDDEEGDPDLWQGNKRRALWKTTCTRAALDPRSSPAERALYAALAPSIQTSGILKSACRTWEDALWATISVLCEERQSEALARLGGGFWEPSGRELGEDVEGEAAEEEEEAWRADVEQELQALATAKVQEGLGADDPFHISQLHIILDSTDALLDDFASRLRDGARDPESSECAFPFMLNPHTLSSPTMSLTGTQP